MLSSHRENIPDTESHTGSIQQESVIVVTSPANNPEAKPSLRSLRDKERKRSKRQKQKAKRKAKKTLSTEDFQSVPATDPSETASLLSNDTTQPTPEDDENDENQQQGWGSWIANGVWSGVKAVGSTLYYGITHPFSTGLALATAAPPALNALANPSGKPPSELGKEWWEGMSMLTRIHSVLNLLSSFGINTIMNALFLPTAWERFKTSIKHTFDSPREFLDNVFSILLSLGGGVSAGAIAYYAFLWLPAGYATAGIPAAISFVVTVASRYLGVKNVFKRVFNVFNKDADLQADFADALEHINEKHLQDFQLKFEDTLEELLANRDLNTPLTTDELEQISARLAPKLTELANLHPDLIKDKTTAEYAAKYAAMIFDITFALAVAGIPAYLTFMQKGFDGINTLAKFAGNDLTGLNVWLRRLIGLAPGLASALTYTDYGTKFRTILTDLAKYLYQNPKQIPMALVALAANGLSTSGPQNVGASVVKNPDNMIGLQPNTALGTTFEIFNALAGGVINGGSSLTKAYLSPPHADVVHITPNDLIKHLSKVNEHLVHHETADQFRLFLKAAHNKHPQLQEDVSDRLDVSTETMVV